MPPSNYNGNAFAYRGDLSDDGLKFVAPWYYYPDLNYTVYSYFENQWIASETIKNTFWTDGAIFDANGEYLVTIGNEFISDYNYLKCSVYKFTDGSWNIEKSSFTELGTPPSINSIYNQNGGLGDQYIYVESGTLVYLETRVTTNGYGHAVLKIKKLF